MDPLIKIDKPNEGDNFLELWHKPAELIDALNDLSVSIVPSDYGFARIEKGSIQLSLDAAKIQASLRALNQSSNPTSGNTDNPGSPGDLSDPDNPGCSQTNFNVFGALCGSIIVLADHRCFDDGFFCQYSPDVCNVYDNRVNNNLIGTMQSNNFGSFTNGITEVHFGIVFGLVLDWINTSFGQSCSHCPPFNPVVFSVYQEDFDPTNGLKKPVARPP